MTRLAARGVHARSFRAVLWFLCTWWAAVTVSAAAEPRRPNILLIVADDLGYFDLGCQGQREVRTPNIDKLAAGGVRLTDFYVSWPACTPSRGSILTGRYPQRNGLYDMIRNDSVNYGHKYTEAEYAVSPEMTLGLDQREVTLAQPLAGVGYTCGMVGKWDSGRARRFLPLARGFDFFYGFANTGIDYWTHERYGVPSMFRGNERIKEEGYATDLFGREALRFIRDNHARPFFLYLAFNAPHGASNLERSGVQAPKEYVAMYPESLPAKRRTYLGSITCMDTAIGEILTELDKLKLAENTLIIFTSDNGGTSKQANGPLRGHKNQLFEGGLRVPCVAHWPGRLPAGAVNRDLLTTLELFPTLLAAASAPASAGVTLDGYNMLDVLGGRGVSPRQEMYWQHQLDRAARVGSYKWVESAEGRGLFDLGNDIGEQHDLSSTRPELLAEIRAKAAAWKKTMDACEPRGPFRDY
jgi:arylsulfatase A-like enzyme